MFPRCDGAQDAASLLRQVAAERENARRGRARPAGACVRRARNNRRVREALLLDLDETLIEEEAAAKGAHEATAELARARTEGLVDPAALVADVRAVARRRWQQSPFYDYCKQIGISSTEGL
jgi:hypothetical protein